MPRGKYDRNESREKELIDASSIAYALSHCETWLENYCKSHGLPTYEFTGRVATLLLSTQSRTLLGTTDSMSSLRLTMPERSKTPRPMAMARSSHSKAQINNKGKKITHGFWSKLTAQERSDEMKRRQRKRLENQRKAA